MSRLDYLTIGIVALCIAALIYLVYRYVNLPHSPENVQPTTALVEKDTSQSSTEEIKGFPAEDTSENVQPGPGAVVEPKPTTKENTPPKSEPVKPKPDPVPQVESPAVNNSSDATATSASGRYMVIAGSFEQKSGAQKQLQKIKKLGYNHARVELFNRGTYAVVLVDRFDQASDAKNLVNALKKQGFDAMMRVKK